MRNKRFYSLFICLAIVVVAKAGDMLRVSETQQEEGFALCANGQAAKICIDADDYKVVGIAAQMLADDVERVTGTKAEVQTTKKLSLKGGMPMLIAGTIGHSALIDRLVAKGIVDVSGIKGKWESYVITMVNDRKAGGGAMLVVAGSDRRGTAFGLTTLCEGIGVSPWYWWADVTPAKKSALYVEPGTYVQQEPSVQYRGIFINDERFGGWARWAERRHGKVGPETYQKVFELLLRLKANYLWPAMHPGTQAFNDDPENARLADDYAIVMGSSHCEQMLRNNEGEWKAVNERAKAEGKSGLGDFNYITNRKTMQDYWETRVKTNGKYENTYTLGLRGIHDYPMEGANSTQERVRLMQQAIDDQRDMLRRNINKPIEEIPQVLCTYEEVLDAYHNGLQ
ncbi:MAG: glycosyl hydrolase 115 family protein, partial [Prevotella sp.]|nr:glycosyl hydrolase 115 family protein [Prevotella sp.]